MAKVTVASLAEQVAQLTELMAAQASGQQQQPATPAAQETAAKLDVTKVPASLDTKRTPSGKGFRLGGAYAAKRDKDGNVTGHAARCYVVPTDNGATQASEKNQFGILRANSIHPAVIRLIAENPKRALEIAAWAESEQAS